VRTGRPRVVVGAKPLAEGRDYVGVEVWRPGKSLRELE
jgi:hypothetical protein